jgi:hypothetical protein
MNYEDFQRKMAEPVDFEISNKSIMINMQRFVYDQYVNNLILQDQVSKLESDIDTMKCVINEIRSDITELEYKS